jgi:hypothetical protein
MPVTFFLVVFSWINALAEATSNAPAPSRLEPIVVTGRNTSVHDVTAESDRVGPANQPEWTTRRAFAETDIYVIPPGEIEFNQFYVLSHPREGKPENAFETEIEFGLPWRTQIDIEPNYSIEAGELRYDSTRIEVPHALANWGKIPFNPTIDGGWRFNNGEEDSFLVRLLFAEEFGEKWHFGANFGYEQQVGGERETEYEINAALSYVAMDRKLAIGAEFLAEFESDDEENSSEVLLGPSILYKPTRDIHLAFVPLFGLTHDAPVAELFFIVGIDLEPFTWKWGGQESAMDTPTIRRPR